MRQVLFTTIIMLFFSCGNTEDHKVNLTDLSVEWQTQTKEITEFSERLNSSLIMANTLMGEWSLSEEELASLDDEDRAAWNNTHRQSLKAFALFTPIQDDLGDFMSVWTKKSTELQSLTGSEAVDQLDANVESKLLELSGLTSKASHKLENWNSAFIEASNELQKSMSKMIKSSNAVRR
jgi:hypothetical protein